MQQLMIIGNVGQDATIVENNGNPFISFSVACNESYVDANGTKHEKTQWYNCVHRTRTNNVAAYIRKGDKIGVVGKPDFQIYRDKQGVAKIDAQIIVQTLDLIGGKKEEPANAPAAPTAPAVAPAQRGPVPASADGDQDLPFWRMSDIIKELLRQRDEAFKQMSSQDYTFQRAQLMEFVKLTDSLIVMVKKLEPFDADWTHDEKAILAFNSTG